MFGLLVFLVSLLIISSYCNQSTKLIEYFFFFGKVGLREMRVKVYSHRLWIETTLVQVADLSTLSLLRYQPSFLDIDLLVSSFFP